MAVMQKAAVEKLFDINGLFYQNCGAAFAETRRRIQPGVDRVLEKWVKPGHWLDLGCGSGALALEWLKRGLAGTYEGLDFSPVLIETAESSIRESSLNSEGRVLFGQTNLADEGWVSACKLTAYDGILMLAALHHIPGAVNRERLLRQVAGLLPAGGLFLHSEWQFDRAPRLMARVQPWSRAGLAEEDVEPGDTLLDWRHMLPGQSAEAGLRYVHLFSAAELANLAEMSGFEIIDEFRSDGVTGDLSLYQAWRKN